MNDGSTAKDIWKGSGKILIELISELKENESLTELRTLHQKGVDAAELLGYCVEGVRRVGLRFEQGEYYISALIMAGEIMRQTAEYLKPFLQTPSTESILGHVLLGTIEGDIHDLGKNILKDLLECNGLKVTDLGVDVPAPMFADKAIELEPDFVAISCLLTTSLASVQQAVARLKKKRGSRNYTIIIGGTAVDQVVNDHIQADRWFPDAIQGAAYCRDAVATRYTHDK